MSRENFLPLLIHGDCEAALKRLFFCLIVFRFVLTSSLLLFSRREISKPFWNGNFDDFSRIAKMEVKELRRRTKNEEVELINSESDELRKNERSFFFGSPALQLTLFLDSNERVFLFLEMGSERKTQNGCFSRIDNFFSRRPSWQPSFVSENSKFSSWVSRVWTLVRKINVLSLDDNYA